jgi:ribonucleotide reductase beta subunit family protein with ferritin-like domain
MNYDQKKERESNWEFDSWPQTLWKQGSNEFWLGRFIHCWKDIFEGYKILPSHHKKILDLKIIW